jgi:hypothetical protein
MTTRTSTSSNVLLQKILGSKLPVVRRAPPKNQPFFPSLALLIQTTPTMAVSSISSMPPWATSYPTVQNASYLKKQNITCPSQALFPRSNFQSDGSMSRDGNIPQIPLQFSVPPPMLTFSNPSISGAEKHVIGIGKIYVHGNSTNDIQSLGTTTGAPGVLVGDLHHDILVAGCW